MDTVKILDLKPDKYAISFGINGEPDALAVTSTLKFVQTSLMSAIPVLRAKLDAERSFALPPVRVHDSTKLAPQEFAVLIDGAEVWRKQFTTPDFTDRADATAAEITAALERGLAT